MNQYLEEAAALLRKAAESNERKTRPSGYERSDREICEGRERIAMKFAQLGAIEQGLLPVEMLDAALRHLVHGGEDGMR
jgi:hypothetical protein